MRFLKVFFCRLNTKAYNQGWKDGYNYNQLVIWNELDMRVQELEKRFWAVSDSTKIIETIDMNSGRKSIVI